MTHRSASLATWSARAEMDWTLHLPKAERRRERLKRWHDVSS